ncbi:DUF2326 domain-containing protein [Candidatus Woesebacteria bacterium]|nr:DUF2326 domain-containing protein [Candidatus Woesebacteria bacterium]
MKIRKIYSNKPFHNALFNVGLNVVFGKPTKKNNFDEDTHNLGKTTLIYLIDFLLLKEIDKNSIFVRNSTTLQDYEFFAEFQVSEDKFFLIHRSINNSSKVDILITNSEQESFEEVISWSHTQVDIKIAKTILNDFISFDVLSKWDYRKGIGYFLRTQSDYDSVFQLDKFRGKHQDWKPFLFELLGFSSSLLEENYELDTRKKQLRDYVALVNEQFILKSNETDKLRGLLQIKKAEVSETQKKIDNFEFYVEDLKLNRELLNNLDEQISIGNTQRYNLTTELHSINKSLTDDHDRDFDLTKVQQLYSEINIIFPDEYLKTFDELKDFQKKLTKERKKFLAERKKELEATISELESELSNLDRNKSEILEVLKDKDSYDKFKFYQKSLVESETEVVKLEEKLKNMMKVNEVEDKIDTITDQIKSLKTQIQEEIDSTNAIYQSIRLNFNSFVKEVLNVPAVISITINGSGNVDFGADVQNPSDLEVTSEGYGTTYRKILCALFDLAILTTYSDKNYFKFVYHDGVLEGLDNRKKVKFISLVRKIIAQHNLQYILSVIDSDIPLDYPEFANFSQNEIVMSLHDEDDSGKLFKISF